MNEERLSFLQQLTEAPGPSGYEGPVRRVWTEHVAAWADRVDVDVQGNAAGVLNPEGAPRLMFAGHMDELGFQILHITDEGFLHFATVGGFDLQIVPGRKVRVHTARGPVLGVIGKKAIHLMEAEERKKVPEEHELWIDIGVADGDEARALVEIGDPVTYDCHFERLRGDLIVSRGLDNKVGAYVVADALRRAGAAGGLRAAVHAVATVKEEIGASGARTSAFGIDPQVAVAVDVTHATDYPGADKRKVGDVRLGGGPVLSRGAHLNPVVFELLRDTAKAHDIPLQLTAEPARTGTDADVIFLSRAGVATGLISLPQRYMHTPAEVVSTADLEHAAELLARFALTLDGSTSFVP